MRLLEVRILNFRNFQRKEFEFSDGINVICGVNGVGKTNLLEACAYLGNPRSFRRVLDRDLVKWGESFFRIEGKAISQGVKKDITVKYTNGMKQLEIDGRRATALDLFRTLSALMADMRDHRLVDGPPTQRRALLDRFISSLDLGYLKTLIDYKRNLGQKNALLRKGGNTRQLGYWNENLEETGRALVLRRERFVKDLTGIFDRKTQDLLPSRTVSLKYAPSLRLEKGVLDAYAEEEKRIGFSVYGPHRDRFDVEVDGRSPASAASEGEKRLTILALYLSVREFLKETMGEEPVLLMDEPFGILSEGFIESLVNELDGQVILTAIGPVLGLKPQVVLQ